MNARLLPRPGNRSRLFIFSFFFAFVLFIPVHHPLIAQVGIQAGETYSENFDSLKNQSQAPLPVGWRTSKLTSVRNPGSWQDATTNTERSGGNNLGTLATNGIYNFGAGEASEAIDRSLGGISSGSASKSVNFYLALENTGEEAISSFFVSYDVKKFRQGTNPEGYRVSLYRSTNGSDWMQAGDTFVAAFGPDATNEGYPSAPGEILKLDSLVLATRVEPGEILYLAWNYSVSKGSTTTNAQALAIDNVVITPVAAPWLEDLTVFPVDSFAASDTLRLRWRCYGMEEIGLDWISVATGDTVYSEILSAGCRYHEWIVPDTLAPGEYKVHVSTSRDSLVLTVSTPTFVVRELAPVVNLKNSNKSITKLAIKPLHGNREIEITWPRVDTSRSIARVVDLNGRLVIHEETSPGVSSLLLSTSGLIPGIYLVIVENGEATYKGKFLK